MLSLDKLDLNPLDVIAFGWFVFCTLGYTLITRFLGLEKLGLIGAIQQQRVRWISNMAQRGDRVIDSILLSNLASGNTFFASTSVILMGGLAALLGSGDKVALIVARLPLGSVTSPVAWDLKVLIMMAIFIFAFFKFAWAFRLANYAMIMIGATPLRGRETDGRALSHAAHTARVIGLSGDHANSGLRAYYYAMAGIGWFYNPVMFMLTTTWVTLIIIRREYYSRSLKAIKSANFSPGRTG